MNKVTAVTAAKMLKLIPRATYQGRITYLAIALLQQTGLGFAELAWLRIHDVYQLGIVRITVQVGFGDERIVRLNEKARRLIADILKAQASQGLQPSPWCPLFRAPSGRPFTRAELASLFWLYQEAAEMTNASWSPRLARGPRFREVCPACAGPFLVCTGCRRVCANPLAELGPKGRPRPSGRSSS